jgi:hypothetical protein
VVAGTPPGVSPRSSHRAPPGGACDRGGRVVAAESAELAPRYEWFHVTYPSGTVVMSFYPGGEPLEEVRVTHPMAVVEVVEDSLVKTRGNLL